MHKQALVRGLKPVPRAVSSDTVDAVFTLLCEEIDSELARKALLLYKNKDWDVLVNLEVDPLSYESSDKYADDQLICKFLSKYRDFRHNNLNPRLKAEQTFGEGEDACRATNIKFASLDLDPSKWDPLMHRILRNARRKIGHLLGKPNLDSIASKFGWGPGANTSASGQHTSAYNKFINRLDVTSNSLIMGHCCINSTPAWVNCQLQTDSFPSIEASLTRDAFNIVRGNEVVFVPKNAKTERTIAKEPAVNSYLQKGLGGEIRTLLKRYAGIDLNDQSVNQRLAKEGSLRGNLATIDLKNASGTISQGIVKFLIRTDWFNLLDSTRSKQGYHPTLKNWFYYQQFSSQGNAYTFELESLIFWGLSKAVSEEVGCNTVSVFGDDIIVEVGAYDLLCEVFAYCGFTVNLTKSFARGPFRESCGKDYFNGTEVRSVYLKEAPSNVESLYKLANSIRRYSHVRNSHYGCDVRFRSVWQAIVGRIPKSFRFLIPEGDGDSGILSNLDEATPHLIRAKLGWGGFHYKHLVRVPVKARMKDEHGRYCSQLSTIGSEEPFLGYYSLRKMTTPKVNTNHTHYWYDLGPWFKQSTLLG